MPRYQPMKVGDKVKVRETHAGDTIVVHGQRVEVRREEYVALQMAAAVNRLSLQQYIDNATQFVSSRHVAKRKLLHAMWPFLPRDYVVPLVHR